MPLERLVYQLTTRTIIRILASSSVLMGVDMALGGPARFGSPGFATARLIPGEVYTWAGVITVGGLLTLGGSLRWRRRTVMTGLAWMGLVFGFLDVTLWWSRFSDPKTAVTGCWIYFAVATTCAVLLAGGHGLRPRGERPS